ncbi:MAG: hypothetical protein IPJ14_17155 [Kineosporiaceae bacterium]|nr:hypothetical protein [Kineosporiaceae bacterium]MBK7624336.1 hypothetical protein [Kineosporiaceae bacterium]MBK8075220.1 hypothetical protein [Kineosporiaceae bacterium]
MTIPTTVESPFQIMEIQTGPWAPITENPVLELKGNEVVVSCPQITARLSYTPLPGFEQELPHGRWDSVERTLDGVPGHKDAGPGLRRFAFLGAPVHGALHQIVDTTQLVADYCVIHHHDDAAELNVLLPGDPDRPLEFDLYNEGSLVGHAPLSLWIPVNAGHCAMATAGTGFFFVLRMPLV